MKVCLLPSDSISGHFCVAERKLSRETYSCSERARVPLSLSLCAMVLLPAQQLASTVKSVAVVLAFGLILYMLSPRFAKHARPSRACASCLCDCLAESESIFLPGYGDLPSSDCARLQEDMDRTPLDLLAEELKLHETIAEESQHRADAALLDAKKVASQYQKEAEKCSSGMETCEEARERSDTALIAQKKISGMWEKRARQLGWRDKHPSLFDRIGLSGVGTDRRGDSVFDRQRARKR